MDYYRLTFRFPESWHKLSRNLDLEAACMLARIMMGINYLKLPQNLQNRWPYSFDDKIDTSFSMRRFSLLTLILFFVLAVYAPLPPAGLLLGSPPAAVVVSTDNSIKAVTPISTSLTSTDISSIITAAGAPTDAARASLVAAIKRSVEVDIRAFSESDLSLLETIYTGEELNRGREAIEGLTQKGRYLVPDIKDLQFQSFTVSPDGSHAVLVITTAVSGVFYDKQTHLCVLKILSYQDTRTVYLARKGDGWIIYDSKSDIKPFPPVPC
jgi:hypothetical protein